MTSINNFHTAVLLSGDAGYQRYLIDGRNKAQLELPAGTFLDYALDAIRHTSRFDHLVVIGPDVVLQELPYKIGTIEITPIPQQMSVTKNIFSAFDEAAKRSRDSLVLFSNDAPLILPSELDLMASHMDAISVDAAIAIARIDNSNLEPHFSAEYQRSKLPLRSGNYLLGNIFAVRSTILPLCPEIESLFALRKQSRLTTLVRTLHCAIKSRQSLTIVLKWLRLLAAKSFCELKPLAHFSYAISLEVSEIENTLNNSFARGCYVKLVDIGPGGACWDIDTAAQLSAMRNFLSQRDATHYARDHDGALEYA